MAATYLVLLLSLQIDLARFRAEKWVELVVMTNSQRKVARTDMCDS